MPSTEAPVKGFGVLDAILSDPAAISVIIALCFVMACNLWVIRQASTDWRIIWTPLLLFLAFVFWHLRYVPTMYLGPDAGYPAWGLVVASIVVVFIQALIAWVCHRQTRNVE